MSVPATSHMHTWFNEPVAQYINGYSLFGLLNDTGMIGVGMYDHNRQIHQIGNPRGSTSPPIQPDDHNNPAIIVLNTGRLLAAYSEHPGKAWAAITASGFSPLGAWTETEVADGSSLYNAYAHLGQTTDDKATIWWLFRKGLNISGGMPLTYRINQGNGAGGSWATPVELFRNNDTANQRPYFRMTCNGRRIDICYTSGHPDEIVACHLYHVYVEIAQDGNTFDVRKSDGTLIDTWAMTGGTGTVNSKTLPLNVTEGTRIYDGTSAGAWIWDVQYVSGTLTAAYPVFTQTTQDGDTHKYRRATLSGGTWTNEDICYAGDSLTPGTVGRVPQWIYPDANTDQPRYSPGICLDPNTADRVYLGKKYADGDVRMQQWDKVAGTWGKTTDLTGASGNGKVNARPFSVVGSPSTQVIWWSAAYTTYANYTAVSPGLLTSLSLANVGKPASPAYVSSRAPAGLKAYYLITEGSGTSVADLTGAYNGSFLGTPTWGSDATYGATLSGFSNSNAVIAHALAASGLFDTGVFPKWIAVLYKSAAATTGQYLVGLGSSGGTNPIFGVTVNNSADNQVGGNYRDAAAVQNQVQATSARDSSWHTLMALAETASVFRSFKDGQVVGSATNTTGTVTFDRFTIGALTRTSTGSPASGCTIAAVLVGSGAVPSPMHIHFDLIERQFLGAWAMAGDFFTYPASLLGHL